jgi:membrane protein required for colicin V production
MIIDIVFIIMLIMAVIKGWQRGLVIAVFSVIGLIVGIVAAMKLSALVAEWLKDSTSISAKWLPFISFAVVFIGAVLLIRLGANLLESTLEVALLGWANKLGGILLYIIIYTLAYSVLLFYAAQLKFINAESIQQSVTYAYIQPLGPWVVDGIGKLIPAFKDMFTELEAFFERIAADASTHKSG